MPTRFLPSCITTLALLTASSAHAQTCGLPQQGQGRIASVIDARTVRLDDGSDIRLKGLAPLPPDDAARATARLATMLGATVTLHGESDAPDRYGRQSLLIRRADADASVQAELLAYGEALADLTLVACAVTLRAAEATARRARLGIWRDASVIKNAESPDDILTGTGRFSVVEGRVLSVRKAGSLTYLNFGRRWTRDFAVTIPERVLASFEAVGLKPTGFAGQRLRIRGFIEQRGTNGPRIEAIRPGQIEMVGADDAAGASE